MSSENTENTLESVNINTQSQEDDGFLTGLWKSVLTPGTSPALIKAVHISFVTLILLFVALVFLSRPPIRIHFVMLLLISIVFYGVVVWFIQELQAVDDVLLKEKKE